MVCLSLKIDYVLANSADPNEMPHIAAFHLGLNCLQKYSFKEEPANKGLISTFWAFPFSCVTDK